MQQAFILNLDPGTYSIRLVNPDGTVMESSEKTVIVHDRSRSNGIGFEVIPGDRWTRPESSVTPSSVLYVDGSADLYLRPFFEEEFNDLAYEKTINNAARATRTSPGGSASSRSRMRRSRSNGPARTGAS